MTRNLRRVSITVDKRTKNALGAIARTLDTSQKQVLIRAIKLLELGVAEKAKGNGFLIVDDDLQPVTRIVGL